MRANVKLLFILFIFISFNLAAQKNSNDSLTGSTSNPDSLHLPNAGIIFDWQANSTAITNNFLIDLKRDFAPTQESAENSEKKLKNKNYFINKWEAGVYYVMPLKSAKSTSIVYELSNVYYQEASFTKDAYQLILKGNAHYRNEKKEIGKLSYRSIEYQKAGIGIRKYSGDRTHCITATLDFVAGDYANQIKVSRGSVFTEENGEYLDIDVGADWRYSSEGDKLLNPKGYGAALNFNWIKLFTKNNAILSVDFKDIGQIHYNSTTWHKTIDTTIHFTGIDVGTLSSFTSFDSINFKDTLLNKFNVKTKNEAYNFTLPALLEIKYEQCLNSKSLLQLQVNLYLYSSLPMFKVAYLYAVKNNLYLGAAARTGGYSKMDIDILARYKSTKIYLDAAVRSVEGLIDPKHSSGLGAYLHLGFFLN